MPPSVNWQCPPPHRAPGRINNAVQLRHPAHQPQNGEVYCAQLLLQEVSPLLPRGFVLAGCRIFCQRLETVTFILQKALGDNLGCNGRNSGSFTTEIHWKGWRGENTGSVMSPSLSSLGLPPQAGGASGRTECWGKPAINQLCLY